MNVFLIIIGVIVLLVGGFLLYRYLIVGRQNRQLNKRRFQRVQALRDKLEAQITPAESEVRSFAENLLTREFTFQLLQEHNQLDLFPEALNNLQSGAASNLANWLEFPTELDACPDEMEHLQRETFTLDDGLVHYEVFKYRVNEPHWAAKDGWILGVVGPYFDDSKPYDFPGATFSRFSTLAGSITPREEARWVHENIALRG